MRPWDLPRTTIQLDCRPASVITASRNASERAGWERSTARLTMRCSGLWRSSACSPIRVDPVRALRFRREARMAARLNHPSIVHIYEIVETDEGDWIVMELVEGKTWTGCFATACSACPASVRLAREIAEGLSEAHGHGIVHRDLKASNVMVNAAGRAKILDFGLAKMYRGGTEQDISAPGMLLGTCHAMSPEQAQGLAIDHRSDLFSLGSLLYEMITGTVAIRRRDRGGNAGPDMRVRAAADSRHRSGRAARARRADASAAEQVTGTTAARAALTSRPRSSGSSTAVVSTRRSAAVCGTRGTPSDTTLGSRDLRLEPTRMASPADADQQRAAADDGALLRRGRRRQLGRGAFPGIRSRDALRVDVPASAARADGGAAPRRHIGERGRQPAADLLRLSAGA